MAVADSAFDIPRGATWERRLDQHFPDHSEFQVAMLEGLRLAGLGYRLYKYIGIETDNGRLPIMNPFKKSPAGPRFGVPLGGIGAGTINRGWRGDFGRWYLQQGFPNYSIVDANAFSAYIGPRTPGGLGTATVMTTSAPDSNKAVRKAWEYHLKGTQSTYHAIFPRSWTEYSEPDPDIKMTCRQMSPVLPDNYKESSYPCGAFEWTIENRDCVEREVSIMFTWQNGTGSPNDLAGGHSNRLFSRPPENGKSKVMGVKLTHVNLSHEHVVKEMQRALADDMKEGVTKGAKSTAKSLKKGMTELKKEGARKISGSDSVRDTKKREHWSSKKKHTGQLRPSQKFRADKLGFAIAGQANDPSARITYSTGFLTTEDGDVSRLWSSFNTKGELRNDDDPVAQCSPRGHALGAAICIKVTVPPGGSQIVSFSLAWDMPIARFYSGRGYYRRYTKFYGKNGGNEDRIAVDTLLNYRAWEELIHRWQNPVLSDSTLPGWYRHSLFNELYYITEGGSVWTFGQEGEEAETVDVELAEETYRTIGKFGYLESMEYIMENTYDVHFYASWALAMLWPKLELSLQCDFGDSCLEEYDDVWTTLHSSHKAKRKVRGAVPHDLGNPGDDPWYRVNSYNIQPINDWKDLNSKFVLQVYRDFILTQDVSFLEYNFTAMTEALERVKQFDKDGDGLIENEGFPDQTYDTWSATGASAYSGGLWVAALSAAKEICQVLGKHSNATEYGTMWAQARESFHSKLWNGQYYNYDTSTNVQHDSIMADMLCGQWYARACGLPSIDENENNIRDALKVIYDFNVCKFRHGVVGAVNGMRPDGKVDKCCLQSVEVWTGTTFGLAATMLQEGLTDEGFRTAFGIVNTTYEDIGYQFQTPEAWDSEKHYRAIGYMRPLAIWGMQFALEKQAPSRRVSASSQHSARSSRSGTRSGTVSRRGAIKLEKFSFADVQAEGSGHFQEAPPPPVAKTKKKIGPPSNALKRSTSEESFQTHFLAAPSHPSRSRANSDSRNKQILIGSGNAPTAPPRPQRDTTSWSAGRDWTSPESSPRASPSPISPTLELAPHRPSIPPQPVRAPPAPPPSSSSSGTMPPAPPPKPGWLLEKANEQT